MTKKMKPALMKLIMEYRGELEKICALIPLEEMERRGTYTDWTFRDSVAHYSEWMLHSALRCSGRPIRRGEDFEAENQMIFEQYKDSTWQNVCNLAGHATTELAGALEKLSEEELNSTDKYLWQRDRALWREVMQAGYWHPMEHFSSYLIDHGNPQEALRIQQTIVNGLASLTDHPDVNAAARYNMACFYARTAQPEKALELLPECFQLNPGLKEWSRQDGDLKILHGTAAFEALFN